MHGTPETETTRSPSHPPPLDPTSLAATQQRERYGDVLPQVLRVVLGGRDLEIFLREGGILEVLQSRERAEQLADGRLRKPLRGMHCQCDRGDVPDQGLRVVQGQD